jgi:hypothetical protein
MALLFSLPISAHEKAATLRGFFVGGFSQLA